MELNPSDTLGIIEDNLSGILIPQERDSNRLQVRHPMIAEYVINDVAPREILADAYILYLEILAHDLPSGRERKRSRVFKIYQDVINHRNLNRIFLHNVDICRKVYESVRPNFADDGHYFLQYGMYELEWGDLDFAENCLLQADFLMPGHPWVATALGYLLMKKGVHAASPLVANQLLEQGIQKLEEQMANGKDPYPYHILGSQMLAFINQWCPRDQKVGRLQDLHKQMTAACERYPLDSQLRQLAESIKHAELSTVLRT